MITYCSNIKTTPAADCKRFELLYTPALHVSGSTPPTFIYHTADDRVVSVQASVDFFSALIKAGVPAEMRIFKHGDHGTGLGGSDPAVGLWPVLLEEWLRAQGLFETDPAATAAAKAALNVPARFPERVFRSIHESPRLQPMPMPLHCWNPSVVGISENTPSRSSSSKR